MPQTSRKAPRARTAEPAAPPAAEAPKRAAPARGTARTGAPAATKPAAKAAPGKAPSAKPAKAAAPAPKPAPSRFPVPSLDALPEDIRTRILGVQEKSGFIPNVFLVLAHRPEEFRAFFAYHDALMEKPAGLSKAEREMIVVATSAANQCQYCVVAHGAILRIRAKSPTLADQVAINYRKADITPRQRAMLDFAMRVALHSHAMGDEDFDALSRHGFTPEDAWDIAAIAGFFGMSNRLANALSIRPNDEFYGLGRG